MDADALLEFVRGLLCLRASVSAATEADLFPCTRKFGMESRVEQQHWAAHKAARAGKLGLTLVPYCLEQFESHVAHTASIGWPGPVPMQLHTGLGTNREELLLSLPLEKARPICELYRQLFGANLGAHTWLRAVEWHRHPRGWDYSKHALKPKFAIPNLLGATTTSGSSGGAPQAADGPEPTPLSVRPVCPPASAPAASEQQRAQEQQRADGELHVGVSVRLRGLVSAAHLNGQLGTVVGEAHPENGRLPVRVGNARPILVQLANLCLADTVLEDN
jgi:hypothetical protein